MGDRDLGLQIGSRSSEHPPEATSAGSKSREGVPRSKAEKLADKEPARQAGQGSCAIFLSATCLLPHYRTNFFLTHSMPGIQNKIFKIVSTQPFS